ncbi:sodium-dependent phosphate transport protein 3-like isoform X1 [Planococcus citri]|uniref:sodium-dependent phosphate transport protein 3-like isoform X1 n=1 Tax=Planococcus citri TaxID=170843 RepID=UPI0031F8B762
MDESPPVLFFSKRLLVAVTIFVSFINFQLLKNNISICIVEMLSNRTTTGRPDFDWNAATIGIILSSSSYGGFLSFVSGFLVHKLGGSTNASLCMLISGLTTLIQPLALHLDLWSFLLCRFVTGIFESFFYASTADIAAHWFPRNERSMLISFSFNGANVGTAIVYPFCGYISYNFGWKNTFYITGAISVIVSIMCYIFVRNHPCEDKWISKEELEYICDGTDTNSEENLHHPYQSILTSKAVISLYLLVFAYMWIDSIFVTFLPLYIRDHTQNQNVDEIGLLALIPNLVFVFVVPLAGFLINFWDNKDTTTFTQICKIVTSFACMVSIITLIAIALISSFTIKMILIVIIETAMAFLSLVLQFVPFKLYPDSSSFIFGFIIAVFSISAVLSQNVMSLIVTNHTVQEWNFCFVVSCGILLLAAVVFEKFGSCEKVETHSEKK